MDRLASIAASRPTRGESLQWRLLLPEYVRHANLLPLRFSEVNGYCYSCC
jgi:hypothetical protein